MYLSYLNYQLNAYPGVAPRKPPVVIDLKNVYRTLTNQSLPIRHKNVTLESIELCANNKGCNPKKNGGKMNYLVAMKNSNGNIKTKLYNEVDKAVLLNIRGKYKLGDTQCELYLRIPKSAAVGARIGMSTQKSILMNSNSDAQIKTLMNTLSEQLYSVLQVIPKLRPSKLVGMAVHGLNLHNPLTGNRPEQKIKNFLQFLRTLDKHMTTHSLDYDKKDGKQVAKGNFKPDEHGSASTIGVTSWTMVDFVGGNSAAQVIQLKDELLRAFEKCKPMIIYTTNAKQPKGHGKQNEITKGCPKNVPPLNSKGLCPSDEYLPLPNKYGAVCCYKRKLNKTTAREAIKKYSEAKIPMPLNLKSRIANLGVTNTKPKTVSSVKLVKSTPGVYYNSKKRDFVYQDKKFNCMLMSKPRLENIALLMKVNPKGFKKDLCKNILKKAKTDANEKYQRVRRRLLKMKAMIANKSNMS